MQKALKVLGQTTGDPELSRLKVDGVVGANTTKAVNYTFTTYGGSTKTDWTVAEVRAKAPTLAMMVESVVRQRGGTVAKAKPKHLAVMIPTSVPAPEPEPERRWIWWAVGGVSVLLVLAMTASVVKKRRQTAAA